MEKGISLLEREKEVKAKILIQLSRIITSPGTTDTTCIDEDTVLGYAKAYRELCNVWDGVEEHKKE